MERLSRYYNLLGIRPGATKDDIYRAYVAAEQNIHEERFADDPAVRRRAQEKLKRINEAYLSLMDSHEKVEELLEDLGQRDVPVNAPPPGGVPERPPSSEERGGTSASADSGPVAEPEGDSVRERPAELPDQRSVLNQTGHADDEPKTTDHITLLRTDIVVLFSLLAILVVVCLTFALRSLVHEPTPVASPGSQLTKRVDTAEKAPPTAERADARRVKRGSKAAHPADKSVPESLSDESLVRRDAELGNPRAQTVLGYRYLVGKGGAKDARQAADWFRKAADQGNAEAQNWLGYLYETGTGVQKSYVEAARWYRLAAEQGNADAQKNLGLMYRRGKGVEKNGHEGVKWLRKAAAQGNKEAQRALEIWQEE